MQRVFHNTGTGDKSCHRKRRAEWPKWLQTTLTPAPNRANDGNAVCELRHAPAGKPRGRFPLGHMQEPRARYHHLYKTAAWRRRRLHQLSKEPLCWMCSAQGVVTPASTVDHVTPHRGDPAAFLGPVRSLCSTHHSSTKQREESRNVTVGVGLDGYPLR